MKTTRNAMKVGCGWFGRTDAKSPQMKLREIPPAPTLADKLRALRQAQRENDREPVDEFFRRGETTARFAYID